MHEYTLVSRLLQIIQDVARDNNRIPKRAYIALGEFDIVGKEQLLELIDLQRGEYSELGSLDVVVIDIPGRYWCHTCGEEQETPGDLVRTGYHDLPLIITCMKCGSSDVEMKQGDETFVEQIVFH